MQLRNVGAAWASVLDSSALGSGELALPPDARRVAAEAAILCKTVHRDPSFVGRLLYGPAGS